VASLNLREQDMTAERAGLRSRKRNQKIAVIAAAGLIVASGATITSMAAWTDTEWVFGGADTQNSVGASSFEVNQNVTTSATTGWTNDLANPGGKVDFTIAAQNLTPGEPVYGFVRLRTPIASAAGDLTLNAPELGTGDDDLFDALVYGAAVVANPAACTEAGFDAGTSLVAEGSSTATGSAVDAFELLAGTATVAGAEKTVCFQLELPDGADDDLQGLDAQPIWNFTAESK